MRALIALVVLLGTAAAQELRIFVVDVEGGQSTLIVSPSGQTLLVDAGFPGHNGRDSGRIADALRRAGARQIDYLLVTHYHLDHVGGVPELAARVPVAHFLDHGPNTETGAAAAVLTAAYQKATAGKGHATVQPGERIPIAGLNVEVVAARGQGLRGGTPNPACKGVQPAAPDRSENAQSAGILVEYGKFRFADLGDLTWNKELDLVCPANPLGTVDLFLVSHHGASNSNSPALVRALHPRVAIMNNGANKGGTPQAWQVVRDSPGLEDLWQLHYSVDAGPAHNSAERLIANPAPNCQGKGITVTARQDGSFTVLNERTGFSKTYK